jgi:hypothetical protein
MAPQLGLGLAITMSNYGGAVFSPESISNLTLWLKFNKNITSDQDNSGSSHDHSTSAGNMADLDKINAWNAFGSTSINAVQTTQSDKPLWETDAADVGGMKFPNNKILELDTDIDLRANTNFTIAIRFKCTDLSGVSGLMGSTTSEFIRISNSTTFRMKINGTNRDFALASGNIVDDEYFTLIIVRSDDSTGNINVFIRGNDSLDSTATGIQVGSQLADASEITIDSIGVTHDEGGNLTGFLKDVLIWDGTAASSAERESLFDYIEAQ